MKNFSPYIFAGLVAAIVSVAVHLVWPPAQGSIKAKETAYERIMRTGTIRCGYGIFDPSLIKDPNTGQLSGIFYDAMEEVGKRLFLKIEWAAEVDYGQIAEGFDTGRYDVFCATVWPLPERARVAAFTIPLYYSGLHLFVRADDHRFDADWRLLDSPDYTLVTNDGDVTDSMAKKFFPKAKTYALPQMTDYAQLLTAIAMKKADAVVNGKELLDHYNEKNPGKIRMVDTPPLQLFPNVMMLPKGEFQLKTMLDTTLEGMLYSGDVERIVMKYTKGRKWYYFPASPVKE